MSTTPDEQLAALAAAMAPTTPHDPFAPGSVLMATDPDGGGDVALYRRHASGVWHGAILGGSPMTWRAVVEDLNKDDLITLLVPVAVLPPSSDEGEQA